MHRIDLGVAAAAMNGETDSGDRHVARVVGDKILIAVVDGLGHGREAVRAALGAVRTIEASTECAPETLVRDCHEALRTTRGVVMSMATIDTSRGTLTWVGVGNVAGVLFSGAAGFAFTARTQLVQGAGVVGHSLPPLFPATMSVASGDTLVFATDGVTEDFEQVVWRGMAAQPLAERILSKHGTMTDDALVCVVRVRGRQGQT